MFPWWWIFIWAPRWPAGGDLSFGDWTNSLFTIREIEVFEKLLQSDTALALGGGPGLEHVRTGPVLSAEERAVAKNLLDRLKARR